MLYCMHLKRFPLTRKGIVMTFFTKYVHPVIVLFASIIFWGLSVLVQKFSERRVILIYSYIAPRSDTKHLVDKLQKSCVSGDIVVVSRAEIATDVTSPNLDHVAFVAYGSIRHALYSLFARVVITTHGIPVFSPNAKYIFLWHGIPLKSINWAFRKSTRIPYYKRIALLRLHFFEKNIVVVSPSRLYSLLLAYSFRLYNAYFLEVGHPRYDYLATSPKDLSDVFSHCADCQFIASSDKRVILYLPTFRDNALGEDGFHEYLSTVRTLSKICSSVGFTLLSVPHPFLSVFFGNRDYIQVGDRAFVFSPRALDPYDLFSVSDILITDYSSVFFDFLYLGKPIIFYVPDLEEYSKERGFFLEPFDVWTPGPKVRNPEELRRVLEELSAGVDPYACKRKVFREIFLTYADQDSTERIVRLIKDFLG